MDGRELLDRLELDDDPLGHEEVELSDADVLALVGNLDLNLAILGDATQFQLVAH